MAGIPESTQISRSTRPSGGSATTALANALPVAPEDSLLDLLSPASPGALEAYPVSPLVSNVRNNGPELVEPLPLDDVPLPDGTLPLDDR